MYSHLAALRLAAAGGALFLLAPFMARGAVVTMNLVCVLNNTGVCVAGPSFGTVTITDTATDTVQIEADLLNPDLKFSNMMFELIGVAGAILNLTDPLANPLALAAYTLHRTQPRLTLDSRMIRPLPSRAGMVTVVTPLLFRPAGSPLPASPQTMEERVSTTLPCTSRAWTRRMHRRIGRHHSLHPRSIRQWIAEDWRHSGTRRRPDP